MLGGNKACDVEMNLNGRTDRTARGINAAATVRLFRHGLHCHIIITRDFNMHDIF